MKEDHPLRRITDMRNGGSGIPERVSALETSVGALHNELGEVKSLLTNIGNTISNQGKFNWGTMAAVVGVILALWAAAINPLHNELNQVRNDELERHQLVVRQGDIIDSLRERLAVTEDRAVRMREDYNELKLQMAVAQKGKQ